VVVAIGALVSPAVACAHASAAKHVASIRSAASTASYSWAPSATGSTASLRGLAAVNGRTAWVGGSDATLLRTTDGGATWQDVSPSDEQSQGTEGLVPFRDIEAWNAQDAVILAIGSGTDSRILVTHNGGKSWKTTFTNQDPNAFYDCMDFFDRRHGLAMSDPVDGKFRILSTSDGGRHWKVLPSKGMPPALDNEFGFAASGQCLTTSGGHDAWIAGGGGTTSRVFHSSDRGRHWTVTSTPIASGGPNGTAGIYGLAFRNRTDGVAVGGDFLAPDETAGTTAFTRDGGTLWKAPSALPGGQRSGVAWVPRTHATVVTVGTNGSDVSLDGGRTWSGFDTTTYATVECAAGGACWAAGADGGVAKLVRP
jgi:photosystem II stability/assembly factor-like uncharacterized protein